MASVANMNSIGDYIRQQREQAKISLRQLAEQAGVSNPYLSQIERGLRISAEALYVQAGILEDRPGDSGVRAALLTDPQLTERQKQVLIEIYESFRKESQKPPIAEVVAVVRDRPLPEDTLPDNDPVVADTAGPGDRPVPGDGAGPDGGTGPESGTGPEDTVLDNTGPDNTVPPAAPGDPA